MASFDKYAPRLKRWEGGFADDPRDAGGATFMGVTLATYRLHFGADKTVEDLKRMTAAQWKHIMKGTFWDKCWADQIRNQSVAEIFVDWCVNSGLGMIKKVQALVGTTADGVVGPKTLAAINGADAQQLHFRIKTARSTYYTAIVRSRPANIAFYDGWMSRLADYKFSR